MDTESSHSRRENPDTILEVSDATVTFGMERGQSRVLDSVDIDIHRGEVLGIVGESGSGKSMFASSLLDAIVDPGRLTGEIRYCPDSGESIDILDLDPEELRQIRWAEISMVFQGAMSSFNPTQKIQTHFIETLDAHEVDREQGLAHAEELLSDLYLEPQRVMDSYPHELSGGMTQRALIALSMVLNPEVLIMDEPTAALDLLMQRSIIRLLREIKRKYNITMLFITHDLPLVAQLADRLAVMYAFEFIELGPNEMIRKNSAHPYTRALLNATPNPNADVDDMRPIEGSSPDPVDTLSGCSYHPRCPLGDENCVAEDPPLYPVNDDHQAACHYWEQVPEAISITMLEQRREQ